MLVETEFKKRATTELNQASARSSFNALGKHRLTIQCAASGLTFILDSGADCSLAPREFADKFPSSQPVSQQLRINAANGQPIQLYGATRAQLDIGLPHCLPVTLLLANIPVGILGTDFLHEHQIDLRVSKGAIFYHPLGKLITVRPAADRALHIALLPLEDDEGDLLSIHPPSVHEFPKFTHDNKRIQKIVDEYVSLMKQYGGTWKESPIRHHIQACSLPRMPSGA